MNKICRQFEAIAPAIQVSANRARKWMPVAGPQDPMSVAPVATAMLPASTRPDAKLRGI